ncbi:Predicted nucleic acid-binding protein, contains PIN domain [Fibrobacter intestinalis]|uniref:Predicted nucleic acid-binding protein, contains PIN domain n=2 Tax=Fibrobacter intestinalis TaxID=28122 RepID=A0A1M6T6U3_9BACT|nr:Predicted nucleic acid-binding protein, contains PIN domain [Fibrobacter intestinalis]
MQIMLDTNVVLDVLLNRPAFVQNSAAILRVASEEIQEFITASAITDIYYIARKELRGSLQAKALIRNLLQIVHVAAVSEVDIWAALESDWKDFEDSVQNTVAEHQRFDYIITRNPSDFKDSNLPVLTPQEFANRFIAK